MACSSLFRRIASFIVAAVCVLALMPTSAFALDTEKCTARPNADRGSEVLGGVETRLTWEGQLSPDESITQITLEFPGNSKISAENARLTVLEGAKRMDRVNIPATVNVVGTTITFNLSNPAPAGSYIRLEVYGVYFSGDGGPQYISGKYRLANGEEKQINDIPAIDVVSMSPFEQAGRWLEDQSWVQAWNSNKFLHLFFNPSLVVTSLPQVVKGFGLAVAIVAVAFPLAIPLGLCLALMRMSRFRVLRGIATTYVNVIRGTPLFLQIYIAFFGLPLAGIVIDNFPLGVLVLAFNSSAYMCEIMRAGIQSIPKGQTEASRSLGMNAAQTMLFVIIPQTVKRVIPTMTSEFILLYKDTSMLAAVGVMEVVMYAKTIVAATGSITPYIVAACFYLVITLPLAKIVGNFEKKLAQ